jgi:Domain of unknown function (DUF6894)
VALKSFDAYAAGDHRAKAARMSLYTFELHSGERPISDETGVWFANRERAVDHAQDVAHELMRGRELQTRSWRLDVYEDGTRVHEVLFASIDPTLQHLRPGLRTAVEQASAARCSFHEMLSAAQATKREANALVARSRGKPYLATMGGQPTIRTMPTAPFHSSRRRGSGIGAE